MKVVDFVAAWVIRAGGIGVTVAFAGIVAFLGIVVVPLFRGAKITPLSTAVLTAPTGSSAADPAKPIALGMDENLVSLWVIDAKGRLTTYATAGGQILKSESLASHSVTAVSNNRGDVAIGCADGTVRVGRVEQSVEYLDLKGLPGTMESMLPGQTMAYKDGVATMTATGQVRVVRTKADLSEPLAVGDPTAPIAALDYLYTDALEALAAVRADGRLFFGTITKKENVMTGKVRRSVKNYELPVPADYRQQRPAALLLGLNGRLLFLVFPDGKLLRYNTDDPEHASVIEQVNLLEPGAGEIASVRMLLGNLTLIVAGSNGSVDGWFPAPTEGHAGPSDGLHMVKAHELAKQPNPVVAIGASARDRQFVTCDANGEVVVRHMTSGTTQGSFRLNGSAPVALVAMAPKNDAIGVVDESRRLTLLRLDNPHPEGSLAQLFGPVWYEGYPKPGYVYQSSSGTDDSEAKLSLVPLIFGTIKATFYAMLFAVPVAIMAAVYTSEFMHPRVKTVVKPLVEMMASLPSVVLGFIAALVLAPIIENSVMAVLTAFVAVPLGLAAFGFVWQLIPAHVTGRLPSWTRFAALLSLVAIALAVSVAAGPMVESVLFYGDFKGWLGGRVGNAIPGWIVLLTPLFLVAETLAFNLWIKPRLTIYSAAGKRLSALHVGPSEGGAKEFTGRPGRTQPLTYRARGNDYATIKLGMVDASRCVLLAVLAVGLAALAGRFLETLGWDLRGTLVGGYVQRNTLIVGMVMGFAVIPIIYTVSEDALASVPDSLRSAALGAGATQWQTAARVVLPVATSGIFSACMIGFGRAAGETMIVLMASGRTPIIDANIFNGLSALSANIATELPEAPVNSTHYRVLFFSALVLFVLTFVVNTTAEIVRHRFRKRAYQL